MFHGHLAQGQWATPMAPTKGACSNVDDDEEMVENGPVWKRGCDDADQRMQAESCRCIGWRRCQMFLFTCSTSKLHSSFERLPVAALGYDIRGFDTALATSTT